MIGFIIGLLVGYYVIDDVKGFIARHRDGQD
jgi:hypothetical protein